MWVLRLSKLPHDRLNFTKLLSGTLLGAPASTGFEIQVSSNSNGTALLDCGAITRKAIRGSVTALKEWGKQNAKYIFDHATDTKDFGFVLVTATFRTKKCSLKCWSQSEQLFSTGVGAGNSVVPLASGRLSVRFRTKKESSGWISRPVRGDQVSRTLTGITNFRTICLQSL